MFVSAATDIGCHGASWKSIIARDCEAELGKMCGVARLGIRLYYSRDAPISIRIAL